MLRPYFSPLNLSKRSIFLPKHTVIAYAFLSILPTTTQAAHQSSLLSTGTSKPRHQFPTATNKPTPPTHAANREEISVSMQRHSDAQIAQSHLRRIPGAATVIDAQQILKGRNLTNADTLAFQPGVFAQASGGGDGLRISVRGSGIQTGVNYFRSGMLMMFDGLPVTTPAGTPYELFESLGLQYTEVLRGANAFDYGGMQLGGAINYVTQTGYNSQKYQARAEAGSFGYAKEQLSSGQVLGKFDYYISLTNSYRGGYQHNTEATSFGVNANFGYKFNDRVSTRLFFRYRQTRNGWAGFLTRDQILKNPKQAQQPYQAWGSDRIQPGTKYYADMTTIEIDDKSKIEVGFNYQDAPIDIELSLIHI